MIKISIILPTYHPTSYFDECVESIYKQTFPIELLELIIILNGEQNSQYVERIVRLIQKKPKELKTHFLQTPIPNVSHARNMGIEASIGEYLCFIDDDDIISENFLEILFSKSNNTSIAVSNVYNFTQDIQHIQKDYLTISSNSKNIITNRKYLSNACCKLIPRTIIKKRRFDLNFKRGEDALFMFKLSDKIMSINKTPPDCIYYRRIRKDSASRKKINLPKQLCNIFQQQIAYTKILLNNPFKYNWILYITRILAVFKTIKL